MSSLKDLLLTYELVKPPQLESVQFLPNQTRYDRLLNYISNKKTDTPVESPTEITELNQSSDGFVGWKQLDIVPVTPNVNLSRVKRVNNSSDYNTFVNAYDEYLEKNPHYNKYKELLTLIAGLESSYKPSAKNSTSSALGWFLFLDKTRHDYDKSSRDEFANNYDLQFEVASRHADSLMKLLNPYKNKIKERGLTDLLALYGMWWRPKSMINYLETGKDDYKNGDGMTISKILEYAS